MRIETVQRLSRVERLSRPLEVSNQGQIVGDRGGSAQLSGIFRLPIVERVPLPSFANPRLLANAFEADLDGDDLGRHTHGRY